LRTVAGELGDALATVLRLDAVPELVVAGRTDTGVHARGQVAHVDVSAAAYAGAPGRSSRSPQEALVARLAGVLPSDIVVRAVRVAPQGFHARFSAVARRYCYRISDTVHRPDPLLRRSVTWVRGSLDAGAMHVAGQSLVGEHDFVAYCRPREGASTVRTLRRVDVSRAPESLLAVELEADAFCHHQVRAIVGALIAVGQGRRPVSWPGDVLAAARRDGSVHVAPPGGLTLEAVTYPHEKMLAAQAESARRVRTGPADCDRS
jgi:tRNA pseudouridine38-40 synthase